MWRLWDWAVTYSEESGGGDGEGSTGNEGVGTSGLEALGVGGLLGFHAVIEGLFAGILGFLVLGLGEAVLVGLGGGIGDLLVGSGASLLGGGLLGGEDGGGEGEGNDGFHLKFGGLYLKNKFPM